MNFHSLLHRVLSLLLLLAGARGQQAAAPPAVSPPVSHQAQAAPQDFIPLDFPRRAAIRDLQYQIDQAQIQIEQLKEKQIEWTSDISNIATDFARVKQVDLNAYQLDAVNVGLKKKATGPAPLFSSALRLPRPVDKH